MAGFGEIQMLLREKAELQSRLSLLAYDGTPEIKTQGSGKYLYIRKRVGSRVTSTYVGVCSEEWHGSDSNPARRGGCFQETAAGLL